MIFNHVNSRQALIKTISSSGLNGASHNNSIPSAAATIQFVRGKRTKGVVSPATQRVVTQLSVLSASRKQPRLLKLCKEDIVRHQTVSNAWSLFQKFKRQAAEAKLSKQFSAIENAMADLKESSKFLYAEGNKPEQGKRFSLELRVPTEYPPNQVWNHNYKKSQE